MEQIKAEVQRSSGLAGSKPEKIDEEVHKAQSRYVLSVTKSLADTHPVLAQDYLKGSEKYLWGDDLERARGTVQHKVDVSVSRNVVREVYDEKKSEAANIEAAENRAKELGIDRPETLDMIRTTMMSRYGQDKRVKADNIAEAKSGIADLIGGRVTGRIPKNYDEFIVMPGAQGLVDRLPGPDKNAIIGQIQRFNAAANVAANKAAYDTLRGIAQDDAERFIKEDITKWPLSQGQMRELTRIQKEKRKNLEGDPDTARALRLLYPAMDAAGLTKAKDKEAYPRFVGALQDAIEVEMKVKGGKPLTDDDMKLIGKRLMQEPEYTGFLPKWLRGAQEKFYESALNMDPGELEMTRLLLMEKFPGVEPSEADIAREYARNQYIKTYILKSKSKP